MALPVRTRLLPSALKGTSNGKLPARVLGHVPGQAGGAPVSLLADTALRGWVALCAAALKAGHTLKCNGTSSSYRSYAEQVDIFTDRYTTVVLPGRPRKRWEGRWWYQRPGTAVAAVPGLSNHGNALAVDAGEERDGDAGAEPFDDPTLNWLVHNEERFGFSHEIQSEPWHLRWFCGDAIPRAVLDYEAGLKPRPPAPQPPSDEEDDMPYKTIIITDGSEPGRVFMIANGVPVHIVNGPQLKAFREGGIVSKDEPVPCSSAQLTTWLRSDDFGDVG